LGLACFDGHKAYTRWLLTDCFGTLRLPPQSVPYTRPALDQALQQRGQAQGTHQLHDLTVAIERTGCYHRRVAHAGPAAHFEVRIVHPRTTKEFRPGVEPDNQTDNLDLYVMQLATVNGRETTKPSWLSGCTPSVVVLGVRIAERLFPAAPLAAHVEQAERLPADRIGGLPWPERIVGTVPDVGFVPPPAKGFPEGLFVRHGP
jgi:hypothetical protein